MRRREFLKLSGSAALAAATVARGSAEIQESLADLPRDAGTFYVSPRGDDESDGTTTAPFGTLQRAQRALREMKDGSARVKIVVLEGTYYLDSPLTFAAEDSGTSASPIV